MQTVVGDRMESPLIDPAGVVSMNHLPHEPEIRPYLLSRLAERMHVSEIQHIGGIQTDAVNLKLPGPEPDHVTDIIPDRRIILIQLRQKVIPSPVFVGETVVVLIISPEIYPAVPVLVLRILPVLFNVLKGKKISPRVVEHAVQNHPNPLSVALLHKSGQVFIGAKTAVQLFVIRSLIPMAHRFKQRADVQRAASDLPHMPDPRQQRVQTMLRLPVRIGFGRPRKTQRINVIKYGFIIPCHKSVPP